MTDQSEPKRDTTVCDAALALLLSRRGPGGLGAKQCDELELLLARAAEEASILSKATRAMGASMAQAKAALLRCHARPGDWEAFGERQRAIGALEELAHGLAETDAQRLVWLAEAAGVLRNVPGGREPRPGGTLPFRAKESEAPE